MGLIVIALAACSAGDSDPLYRSYAFVTNTYSGSISAFAIDPATGALRTVAGSPFRAGSPYSAGWGSVGVAVDPSGKFIYVANDDVFAFAVDPATGALAAIAGSPFRGMGFNGEHRCSVAVDPSGRFVYAAGYYSYYPVDLVSAFTIDAATGALTAVAGSPGQTGSRRPVLAIDPAGKFVYIMKGGAALFAIDAATGSLAEVAGFFVGYDPTCISIDPSGKFAYVAHYIYDDIPNEYGAQDLVGWVVSAFAVDAATGALAEVAGSPLAAGDEPCAVAVDPSGRFVYVANRRSGDVSAFAILAATGALKTLPGSPFAAGDEPCAIAVDPSGRFVYVANHYSNDVTAFAIDEATGRLTAVTGSPFAAGEWPSAVAIARIAQ